MSNFGNKITFSKNLNHYMKLHNKSRKEICKDLGFSYSTFTDWINAKKYPRIDKIEMLANYFNIEKSDLIEEKLKEEEHKKNDALSDVIVRMRTDEAFFDTVSMLYELSPDKLAGVKQMLSLIK